MSAERIDGASPDHHESKTGSVLGALVSVVGTFLTRQYGQSLGILRDEKRRLLRMALFAICAAVFALGALLFLSVGVIVFFWAHHRIEAMAAVVMAYSLLAILSLWRLRRAARRGRPLF